MVLKVLLPAWCLNIISNSARDQKLYKKVISQEIHFQEIWETEQYLHVGQLRKYIDTGLALPQPVRVSYKHSLNNHRGLRDKQEVGRADE